jgi:hypothetical protein
VKIREIHVRKLEAARRNLAVHVADFCREEADCAMCDSLAQLIEYHNTAIAKIDAGTRQMRIASQ